MTPHIAASTETVWPSFAGVTLAACEFDATCVPAVCDACIEALPPDARANADVQDYVRHYCGLECLERWRAGQTPP